MTVDKIIKINNTLSHSVACQILFKSVDIFTDLFKKQKGRLFWNSVYSDFTILHILVTFVPSEWPDGLLYISLNIGARQ